MMPADWYRERIAAWTARRGAASIRALRFSRLRLVTFLGGVALIWWGLAHGSLPIIEMGAAALVAFGCCVVLHARVLEQIERADTAIGVSELGLARLVRDWRALADVAPPSGLDFDVHPYARDLDLFGHASLTKWLGRPATSEGGRRLWRWLLEPASPDDIPVRQTAVEELASKREWRETLAIEGALTVASQADITGFLEWAESRERTVPRVMLALAVLLPLSVWILGALFLTGATVGPWWLIPLFIEIVLSYAFSFRIYPTFDRAGMGERGLHRYVEMLSLVCRESWSAPELVRVRNGMTVGGSAPAILAKLARIAEWSELRSGAPLFHLPIQALTMWDFHLYFALHRWRVRSGRHVRGWLDDLGSVDALAVLAMVRADQPGWAIPRVDAQIDRLMATSLGHPLLAEDRCVANDVQVGPPGSLLLVTGSNMSGKSTLLRAIGLNTVLAQAGAPVCAVSFSMPSAALYTSIRVQDSLELGLSYFMAALARLKQIVDAALRQGSGQAERGAEPARVLMYLLDEVLQGTNSVERSLAVRAVAQHLLDAGAIGAMTTHDLALADEEPLKSAAALVHFTEQVHTDGTMTFDYRLRPGIATSSNALRLMQLIGIAPR
jgi:hypothetical protein